MPDPVPRTVVASLDRFEEGVAVFEDRESGSSLLLPRDALPPEARPGDLARIETGEAPRFVELLPEATLAKKEELAEKRDRLRSRR